MQIYFLQFLGKINRIVKSYPDIEGYSPFIIQGIGALPATNFRYNDGITTSEVYNFGPEYAPDYAILVDNDGTVKSRWYVSETKYVRYGQVRVSLTRDVLADFRDEVLGATSLIEKATVSDNDPAIYNQEQATFNMIKKAETLLKDGSGSAWLVGYLSSDNSAEKTYTAASSNEINISVNGLSNWSFYKYIANDFIGAPQNLTYNIKIGKVWANDTQNNAMSYSFNKWGTAKTDTRTPKLPWALLSPGDYAYNGNFTGMFNADHDTSQTGGRTYTPSKIYEDLSRFLPANAPVFDSVLYAQNDEMHTEDQEGALKALDGYTIFDTQSSKAYKIEVKKLSDLSIQRYTPSTDTALFSQVKSTIQNNSTRVFFSMGENANAVEFYTRFLANTYRLALTEISTETASIKITAARNIVNDAPYTIFAIPYHAIDFKVGASTYTSDRTSATSVARQISLELMSSGALYDLQLLPYCPRQDLIKTGFIDLRSAVATEESDYELILDNDNNVVSFMIFAKESSFTFDINKPIEITEKKVQNQCDTWRLCSPNYNGVFEFNAVKNNGVDYFNVDCTYRPYNPYIHVNPNFKELYGNDYDDARGLICSGDFSMPACTDKWLEYEAQNKNYQQSFDRSIQHMEVEQKYQRIQQIAGAVAGVGQGAVGGGMIGGVVGAIAGGALSAAGAAADIYMSEQLRSEQIRYAKDQFSFNLENIKALPNCLAKVSAFNKNNKIFPFLEYYSCTDIEKEAFRNVLKYDGMTVNRIGRIIDFLRDNELQYIKARLIRIEDLHDDQHIVDFIASEMEKGAYYDTRSD